MRHARTHNSLLIAALVVLLAVLALNGRALQENLQRKQLNRIFTTATVDPSLALVTFALGPMRGLIADVLWWRSIEMQDRGDFFEMIQLADWISKLQPTMAMVWAYNGWNMTANIVNEVQDPMERWKWVDQGITLMRNDGLHYNPGNPIIRRELASTFLYRIGGHSDPFSETYRRQWITITERYFKTGDAKEIQAIIDAPATEELLRQAPGVTGLLTAAQASGLNLLDFRQFSHQDEWTDDQRKLMDAPEHKAAITTLRHYHAKRQLPIDLCLDPKRMQLIDKHYGPFDWRLWQAQAVYWAANDGLAGYGDEPYGSGMMENTFIQQAMVSSFREGKLVYMSGDLLMLTNNLPIATNVDEFMHHMYEDNPNPDPGTRSLFANFHESAAVTFYIFGYEKQSRELYEAYRREFMSPEEKKRMNYEAFIATKMAKLIHTREKDTYSLIQSTYYQAYLWYALGDSYQAQGYENFAKLLYNRHQAIYSNNPGLRLPPIGEIRRSALALATGNVSTLPKELRDILLRLRGKGDDLTIKVTGKRPTIELPHHDEEEEAEPHGSGAQR